MNIFQQRRTQLLNQIENDAAIVIFAGKPVANSADSEYEFNANRNYYYLTGINEPEGILLLYKNQYGTQETLFVREINPNMEKWIGKFMPYEMAKTISGISRVDVTSSFEGALELLIDRVGLTSVYVDIDRQHFGSTKKEADLFVEKVRHNFPTLAIKDAFKLIAAMRLIKDEAEINAIKEAAQLTNKAIEFAVKNMTAGKYEYQVMADFLYQLHLNNASEMFDTIMASGENATILHYVQNDGLLHDGDLVLFDLGAKLNHYGADISRTYPVNGKFSDKQKMYYNIVLEAMELVNKAAKPGATIAQLNQIVIDYYGVKLQEIGLIKDKSEVSKYYYHGVGHSLGLDTHDVGYFQNMPLQPGFVITNEPGLYIAQEKIGIRIETDLLITQDGCVDLAPQIKRTVEEIEELMRG